MPIERRSVLKNIGGIAALTALAGCIETGGSDDSNAAAEMTLWHDFTDSEEEDVSSYAADFEEETDYAVQMEGVGELDTQLETSIPAGEGPHTWAWAHDWVGRFVDRDSPLLYDASDDVDVDLGVYSGAAESAVQYQGGLYGLPFASETVALFYNKDMVSEPPETLDEMVDIMQDFHNPANGEYGLSFPATDPYFTSGFIQAFGGNMYDESSNEVTLDSSACVEGLEALESTLFNFVPEDPSYEAQTPVFSDEVAPFAINGPWELGGFSDEVGDIGVTTLPTVDGNNPRSFSGIQMWYFSRELENADQDEIEATIEWADWYTTTQRITQNNADNHGMIPVHTEHAENGEFSSEVQAFSEQVNHGTPTPSHPDMDSVWGPTSDALTRVFNGDQSPAAALDEAASTIRDNL